MEIDYTGKDLFLKSSELEKGSVKWQSPSNIALVKYWGKYGNQQPRNPSISFTLTEALTEMEIIYQEKKDKSEILDIVFYFDGKKNEQFGARVKEYLYSLLPIFPFLKQLSMRIQSENTFPHSAGIASSASAMSAIALCLCSMEDNFFHTLEGDAEFERKSSYVARLGSGSACRSIYAEAALWGNMHSLGPSSDYYAVPIADQLHPIFKDYRDSILIVNKEEKSISSSAGHQLMETHPYAGVRYNIAEKNCDDLYAIMKRGDLEQFINIVESEAMQLHALMMMSNPSYLLLQPATISIIKEIQAYRTEKKIPICYTLDAGPNVHLLYPSRYFKEMELFIENRLLMYCEGNKIINDRVGPGPLEL